MQEAKHLIYTALEVALACVFLGLIVYVGKLSTSMWNVYERNTQVEQEQKNYSKYAAYDNTEVRGQELVSLISKANGDPFVVISDTSGNVLAKSYDDYTGTYTLTQECFLNLESLSIVPTLINAGTVGNTQGITWDYSAGAPQVSDIQEFFLNGSGTSVPGRYSVYQTYLVYAGEGSTEILGVIAVRN